MDGIAPEVFSADMSKNWLGQGILFDNAVTMH